MQTRPDWSQSHTIDSFPLSGPSLTPFMAFWKSVNDILRSRELPEMFYGEARDWWDDCPLKNSN
jgi:hypothetical protein